MSPKKRKSRQKKQKVCVVVSKGAYSHLWCVCAFHSFNNHTYQTLFHASLAASLVSHIYTHSTKTIIALAKQWKKKQSTHKKTKNGLLFLKKHDSYNLLIFYCLHILFYILFYMLLYYLFVYFFLYV